MVLAQKIISNAAELEEAEGVVNAYTDSINYLQGVKTASKMGMFVVGAVATGGGSLATLPASSFTLSQTALTVVGGVDCIVFTAGVGENSSSMRASICDGLEYLGVKLDAEKNKLRGEEVIISTPDSKVTVWVIPTNEELMIAQDTAALTK